MQISVTFLITSTAINANISNFFDYFESNKFFLKATNFEQQIQISTNFLKAKTAANIIISNFFDNNTCNKTSADF